MLGLLVWDKMPSTVMLVRPDGTNDLIEKYDCVTFLKTNYKTGKREKTLAKITGIGFSGGDPNPRCLYYTPYRIAESRWATPITPMRVIYPEDLESVQLVECPLGNSGYELDSP
jgi:hypothetical protein